MTSKYDALGDHLVAIGADAITLTFAEVEEIVGSLPTAARHMFVWWGATPSGRYKYTHAFHWFQRGYVADRPDFPAGTVTFRRVAR